jgi:4-diphosphocytidyl-2-C-methyl-D-erythritol kinase
MLTSSPAMTVSEFARAKINLTLDVLGKRADGYHELVSLVVFAKDFGDTLTLTPGAKFELSLSGPRAAAVDGPNLVETANARFAERLGTSPLTGSFHLEKHIPVAAGLGGGSADAAAALRALMRINPKHGLNAQHIDALARAIGADVPACLRQQPLIMMGVGERIVTLEAPVALPAVLVNPGVPLSTRLVFETLNAGPLAPGAEESARGKINPPLCQDAQALRSFVLAGRNDLEPPARTLSPVIGEVIAALRETAGCWLARLSGSGPTCFGLYGSPEEAETAAGKLGALHPGWWVRATTLG